METPQGSVLESRSESALWFAFFGVARAYCPLQGSIAPFGISAVDHLPRRSPRQPPTPKGLPLIRLAIGPPSWAEFWPCPTEIQCNGRSMLVSATSCRLSKNARPQCTPLMDGPRSQVHYSVVVEAHPNPWVKRVRRIAPQPRISPSRLA